MPTSERLPGTAENSQGKPVTGPGRAALPLGVAAAPISEPEFDVASCLDRVRAQDDDAARALVGHLYPLVMKIVRSHLPVRTAEEDLAQEIFIKLFQRLGQYEARDGVPLSHWVSRLAVTTCLDALRAEKRRPELRHADLGEGELAWLEFFTGSAPAEHAPETEAAVVRDAMHKLLATLEPPDRLVLQWLDLEGRPVKEISALTGWSVSLVKVRAFRARRRLRKAAEKLKGQLS